LAALQAERPALTAVAGRLAGRDRELVALGGGAIVGPRDGVHVVGAESPPALAAVDHGVGEVVQVATGLPDGGMHEDRRVDPHHVGAGLHEVAPPHALDVVLELHAERAIVPARAGTAVDLARLKDEAAALGERYQHVHVHRLASSRAAARPAMLIDSRLVPTLIDSLRRQRRSAGRRQQSLDLALELA